MRIKTSSIISGLLLCLLSACSSSEQTQQAGGVQTDAIQLEKLIHLPATALRVQWESGHPDNTQLDGMGADDWYLIAIIQFSNAEQHNVLSQSSLLTNQQALPAAILNKPWLTDVLKTNNATNTTLSPSYSADAFAKPPLLHGFFAPLDDQSHILLYLYTM